MPKSKLNWITCIHHLKIQLILRNPTCLHCHFRHFRRFTTKEGIKDCTFHNSSHSSCSHLQVYMTLPRHHYQVGTVCEKISEVRVINSIFKISNKMDFNPFRISALTAAIAIGPYSTRTGPIMKCDNIRIQNNNPT